MVVFKYTWKIYKDTELLLEPTQWLYLNFLNANFFEEEDKLEPTQWLYLNGNITGYTLQKVS